MISDVRYPSFKRIGWKTRANLPILLLVAMLVTALIKFYWILPAVLFSVYLLYGLVRPWISARWRRGVEGGIGEPGALEEGEGG